jgi:hypothetical protein
MKSIRRHEPPQDKPAAKPEPDQAEPPTPTEENTSDYLVPETGEYNQEAMEQAPPEEEPEEPEEP